MKKNREILLAIVILLIMLFPLFYTPVAQSFSTIRLLPELELPTTSAQCVKEAQWMRANHMKLLFAERDLAVRDGIRTAQHSLQNCSSCHSSRARFCDKCHDYAGVKPECFGCHYFP